ncbi:MAG TPA: DNA polymerase III, partial [Gemmatimonadetes bacterium]|nr:DNA polymerase III [Gemmatimonadota bacterium]
MENVDVERILTELADLLEIQGASPFRIRAYRNAVNTINSLSRPLQTMLEAGEDLTELPGVGKSVAKYIAEFLETGSISRLEEVSAEFPRSLVQLMKLDGVGPKKARKLFEELDVRTVDELATELESGRVQKIEGFGVKSGDKIV